MCYILILNIKYTTYYIFKYKMYGIALIYFLVFSSWALTKIKTSQPSSPPTQTEVIRCSIIKGTVPNLVYTEM